MFREVLTSFATLGCIFSPEGGVEVCNAGTDALGIVGKVIAFGKAPAAPARDLDDDQDGDSSILLEGVWSELIAE